jgi:alkaline phosphatase D
MWSLLTAALLATPSLASFGANLNYRSPSSHHPGLGISLRKVVKRNEPNASYTPEQLNFTHGVASGDPYPNSVILWTRCAPTFDDVDDNSTLSGYVSLYNPVPIYNGTDEHLPPSKSPVCLNWAVGLDQNVTQIVSQGMVYTSSDVDYTVKVEALGLMPFTRYYYQFSVCNSDKKSMVGRTKTTPNAWDEAPQVGIAVYSCSNYPFGFFNAYGNPVRKDSVDYVVHLGDYIYEYAEGEYGYGYSIDRISLPDRQIYTLYDYRKRYSTYRNDPDLVLSHANFPWIPVWDDHETADNR